MLASIAPAATGRGARSTAARRARERAHAHRADRTSATAGRASAGRSARVDSPGPCSSACFASSIAMIAESMNVHHERSTSTSECTHRERVADDLARSEVVLTMQEQRRHRTARDDRARARFARAARATARPAAAAVPGCFLDIPHRSAPPGTCSETPMCLGHNYRSDGGRVRVAAASASRRACSAARRAASAVTLGLARGGLRGARIGATCRSVLVEPRGLRLERVGALHRRGRRRAARLDLSRALVAELRVGQ